MPFRTPRSTPCQLTGSSASTIALLNTSCAITFSTSHSCCGRPVLRPLISWNPCVLDWRSHTKLSLPVARLRAYELKYFRIEDTVYETNILKRRRRVGCSMPATSELIGPKFRCLDSCGMRPSEHVQIGYVLTLAGLSMCSQAGGRMRRNYKYMKTRYNACLVT